MTIEEFTRQPKGPYLFYIWLWNKRVTTSLGEFEVKFHMTGDRDKNPPDEEMLRRAAELVHYAETCGDYLLDIVYGAYLLAGEDDWLEYSGVPEGLSKEEMPLHLREDRAIVVSRDTDWKEGQIWDSRDGPYESRIHVVPHWDEEHALSLDFRDGQIVSANGEAFLLEDGVLRPQYPEEED